jgi:putative NIF3 family GTP cyclohydrolase 1 type 2
MPTVRDIIASVTSGIPGAPFGETVDTLKVGSPDMEVRSVVTTFMATHEVLEEAVSRGANLVITHEPTFYSHEDRTDWIGESKVFQRKWDFARDNRLAIWRCHDYAHSLKPDVIIQGVIDALGWTDACSADRPVFDLPEPMPVPRLIEHLRGALHAERTLVSGDTAGMCRRVLLLVGAPGGHRQIEAIEETGADTIIAGESPEWETPAYVADAAAQGGDIRLLLIGHQPSEEAGMAGLATLLTGLYPGLPVTHIPCGDYIRRT